MTCKTCLNEPKKLQCIQHKENSQQYGRVTCDWCVFKAGLEPTNRGARGWQILGVTIADGLYFAFEDREDNSIHTIHITCFACLADTKSRLQILKRSKRWWLYTNKSSKEYPSRESFRLHFPKYFDGVVEKTK